MIDNVILESIQSFCAENVAPKMKLQVPYDDDITKYELMNPNVFIGWLPPPNQLDDAPLQLVSGIKKALPAMVIGMDEGDDDGNDAGIAIRITFIVYNPGLYPADQSGITPNFKGYRDLLNLIFLCRQQLAKRYLIGGRTAAQKPFRWGMYSDQPAGYWAGYLTFRATAAVLEYIPEPDLIPE